jgi:outer membrane protein assembly factor BamB
VIVGERIYALGNKGIEDEYVFALEVKDGKQIWSTTIGKVGPNEGPQYPGARSTPTVDGDVLYAFSSDGDLACLETATGKVRWKKNVRTEFGGKTGNWAYCESIIVDGDAIYCSPGGTDAAVVALNKKTGDVIWKCALPEGDTAGNASPILVEVGGLKQYVQPMGKGVLGVDVKTGKFLWRFDKVPGGIPTPVAFQDSIYLAGGRSGGGVVKLKVNGGAVETEQVYFSPKMPTAIGGTVKVGDHLYGTTQQGMMCADFATGETKWQERGIGVGSVCFAEGRLYVHGEEGDVALVEASPEGYREKGRFTPPEQPSRANRNKAWAYPVVANGKLYIRDQNSLWCYDVQAAKQTASR